MRKLMSYHKETTFIAVKALKDATAAEIAEWKDKKNNLLSAENPYPETRTEAIQLLDAKMKTTPRRSPRGIVCSTGEPTNSQTP